MLIRQVYLILAVTLASSLASEIQTDLKPQLPPKASVKHKPISEVIPQKEVVKIVAIKDRIEQKDLALMSPELFLSSKNYRFRPAAVVPALYKSDKAFSFGAIGQQMTNDLLVITKDKTWRICVFESGNAPIPIVCIVTDGKERFDYELPNLEIPALNQKVGHKKAELDVKTDMWIKKTLLTLSKMENPAREGKSWLERARTLTEKFSYSPLSGYIEFADGSWVYLVSHTKMLDDGIGHASVVRTSSGKYYSNKGNCNTNLFLYSPVEIKSLASFLNSYGRDNKGMKTLWVELVGPAIGCKPLKIDLDSSADKIAKAIISDKSSLRRQLSEEVELTQYMMTNASERVRILYALQVVRSDTCIGTQSSSGVIEKHNAKIEQVLRKRLTELKLK